MQKRLLLLCQLERINSEYFTKSSLSPFLSKGTDHGQASVHFALGGKVRGGLYGKYPSLSNLDSGDLKHNIDFKSIYSSIAEDWWSVKKPSRLEGFAKIKFL